MAVLKLCTFNLMTKYLPKDKTTWQKYSVVSTTEAENRHLSQQIVHVLRLWHTRVVDLPIF